MRDDPFRLLFFNTVLAFFLLLAVTYGVSVVAVAVWDYFSPITAVR